MSRHLSFPGRTQLVLGVLLLAAGIAACEEDGKTVPANCPKPPLYDIQGGGDGKLVDPDDCITDIGHAVNMPATSSGGTSSGGSAGKGGKPAAEAGAGAGGA
jgi:hypothetical protein